MKKPLLITGIFLLLANSVFAAGAAGDLRKKAEENPLDCALYLLLNDREQIDPSQLATAFFEAGRYDDAVRALNFNNYDFQLASHFAERLLKKGDKAGADKFIVQGLDILKADEQYGNELKTFLKVLILSGRIAEADQILGKQDDEYAEDKAELLLIAGLTLLDTGHVEKAAAALNEAYALDGSIDDYYLVLIARSFLRSGKTDKASEIIKRLEGLAQGTSDEREAHKLYMGLVPLYFETGNAGKGLSVWQEHRDTGELSDEKIIAEAYIKAGDPAAAKPYLLSQESQDQWAAAWLVKIYLEQNDPDNALRIARMMSLEEDSSRQQSSLMLIADKFIESGKIDAALELLNFAFVRTTKVGETHSTPDSIGASPLTRKIIFLRDIRNRYITLKRYDKVPGLLKAFKSDHEYIDEFKAETYVSLAKAQVKTLPVKKLVQLLTQAQNAFSGDDESGDEFDRDKIEIDVADVYAKSGDKAKASELLVKTLKHVKDEYYLDELLIYAGKVFEENKLKATPELKKVLREIIGDETVAKNNKKARLIEPGF